ncbi:MAG: lasso peptide biosynthesis B2 protein [bacterium]
MKPGPALAAATHALRGGRVPGGGLIRAVAVVLSLRLALWFLPFATVMSFLDRRRSALSRRPDRKRPRRRPAARPRHIAWRVSVAARIVPSSSCLVQALAGQQLLAAEGYESIVHFGIAASGTAAFAAHAWLDCNQRTLIGGATSGYVTLDSARRGPTLPGP